MTTTAQTATTDLYATGRDLYLSWVDASLQANERMARVARTWLDESLATQQDIAAALKRAAVETQETLAEDGETPTPFTLINRSGDIARVNYGLWTETALKAQERWTRILQTAFAELQAAGTDMAQRTAR
jgi:hypothetical protein